MFRRFIGTPFDEGGNRRTLASERLGMLLDSLCLRRTRQLIKLPEPQYKIRTVHFSRDEREQYEQTKKTMIRVIQRRAGEEEKKSLFGLFQAQLHQRILCNHGTFQRQFSWADKRNLLIEREDALCSMGQNGEIDCSACHQRIPVLGTNRVYKTYTEECAHVLCLECLDQKEEENVYDNGISKCPLCHPNILSLKGISFNTTVCSQEEQRDDYFRAEGFSSKMNALVTDIMENLWETKRQVLRCPDD